MVIFRWPDLPEFLPKLLVWDMVVDYRRNIMRVVCCWDMVFEQWRCTVDAMHALQHRNVVVSCQCITGVSVPELQCWDVVCTCRSVTNFIMSVNCTICWALLRSCRAQQCGAICESVHIGGTTHIPRCPRPCSDCDGTGRAEFCGRHSAAVCCCCWCITGSI